MNRCRPESDVFKETVVHVFSAFLSGVLVIICDI